MTKHLLYCLLLLPALVVASSAHVHGVAALNIVVDGAQLTVSLESPLDALVGFERPPRNAREREVFADMGKVLNDAAALFVPAAEAKCSVKSVTVKLPFAEVKADKAEHADVDADYVFTCAQPAALTGLETTLFKRFSRLYRLEVRRVGPKGQGAGQMTPKKPSLSW
jgi:hypothetical protein